MTLREAVIKQLGGDVELLGDVAKYGAQEGWRGFTYTKDTIPFVREHKALILTRLKVEAVTSVIEFVSCFRCLDADLDTIAASVYGKEEDTQVYNALAWFALEAIAGEE